MAQFNETLKQSVIGVVSKISFGQLTTYGTVGKLTGINPQVVGWILTGFTDAEMENIPWQRVVAKHGVISSLKLGPRGLLQIEMLRNEGWEVGQDSIVDFIDSLDELSEQPLL